MQSQNQKIITINRTKAKNVSNAVLAIILYNINRYFFDNRNE